MHQAPRTLRGRLVSPAPLYPPVIHEGNLDNMELVAGTTLFIRVQAPGALFEVGDGQAAQGDGQACIRALETSLVGTLEFVVRSVTSDRCPVRMGHPPH